MTDETCYEILELEESASTEEIKRAFKRLAREYHPDTIPKELRSRRIGREAEETFQLLSYAYKILSDPASRSQYDAQLRRSRNSGSSRTKGPGSQGSASGPRPQRPPRSRGPRPQRPPQSRPAASATNPPPTSTPRKSWIGAAWALVVFVLIVLPGLNTLRDRVIETVSMHR